MKKYIVGKKHTSVNYVGASVATAAILMSSPTLLCADSTIIDDVTVTGTQEKVEYSKSYKVDKSSSSKITQDLVDTPQTISVITNKVMQEQQSTTLQEALRNTPGITLLLGEGGNTNSKNNISLRGFDVSSSIYKDGVRELNASTRDTFNTEAVEVTKGTVGADNGRSVASGYINQVTKSAKNVDAGELTAGYSTAKNARLTADLNKKLSETSGIRLNVMKNEGDVAGRDGVEIDRTGIAASLGFGIGTETRTTINYERYEQDDIPDGGVSVVGLDGYYSSDLDAAGVIPSKVNTENFYGTSSDFEKVTTDTFTVKFEHDFSDKTTLTNTTRYAKSKLESLLTSIASATFTDVNDSSTWTVSRSGQTRWQENEILTNHTNVVTSFNTGNILHNLSSGFDITIDNQTTKGIAVSGTYEAANLYNPNSNSAVSNLSLAQNRAKTFGETKTLGAYVFDSVNIGENFILTGGGRIDKYTTKTDSASIPRGGTVADMTYSFLEDSGTLKSFKLGAVYKPTENGSIYLSYANSQLPPGGSNYTLSSSATSSSNSAFDPQESSTTELGTKWELLNKRLSLTAAIYKTEVTNEVMTETDGSVTQNGEREVKGIELGIVGEITDNWAITAGIAKSKTEVLNATNTDQEGASLTYTPDLTATLWSTYRVTPSFLLGAGARYVGEMYTGKANNKTNQGGTSRDKAVIETDSYVVFDAMASYKISKDLSAQVNIYNLADKEYVSNINNNGHRYTPGAPRTALFSHINSNLVQSLWGLIYCFIEEILVFYIK